MITYQIGGPARWLRRTALVGAIATLPVAAIAENMVEPDAAGLWTTCLVEQSRSLASSQDSSPVIADAAMSLCFPLEGAVRLAVERAARDKLVRDGVASDDAEATRVQRSIGSEGWNGYLAIMRRQLPAVVFPLLGKACCQVTHTSAGLDCKAENETDHRCEAGHPNIQS